MKKTKYEKIFFLLLVLLIILFEFLLISEMMIFETLAILFIIGCIGVLSKDPNDIFILPAVLSGLLLIAIIKIIND